MSIQRVSPINFKKSNKTNNNETPLLKQSGANMTTKHIGMKDMIFSYPISFGRSQDSTDAIFEESLKKYYRFTPDKYQRDAAKVIFDGNDPLTTAPTGTGKTLIGENAIFKNLEEGKKTYYTTPLKALSNEKYTDFCKLFGKQNVGLMTGDIKINKDAPVVIMTTEVYRNILMGDKDEELKERLKDVKTVIYDEFHYMNDPERGEVWETSIMYTPPHIQQIPLSATAKNGAVVTDWMNRLLAEKGSSRMAVHINVPPEERHVPLIFKVYDSQKAENKFIPLINKRYNLDRLSKALRPDTNKELSEQQKNALSQISKYYKGNETPEHGMQVLNSIVNDKSGPLENLEEVLVKKTGANPLEIKRIVNILADSYESKFNEKLKTPENKKNAKDERKARYSVEKTKVIALETIDRLALAPQISHNKTRAFEQLSAAMYGDMSVEDGLAKAREILGNKDMPVQEFENKLRQYGLRQEYIHDISKSLTLEKTKDTRPKAFDIIDILKKEEGLPAIFFSFSQKNCDKLKKEFVKTQQSLLSGQEREAATEIIKKHMEKGNFFGTGEDPSTLLSGVGVHHAGKMPGYKALVEELAQNKLLKAVFATPTLGAGINVPAKTVVFLGLERYNGDSGDSKAEKFVTISNNEFHQMAGRAGRRGKDSIGNVIVVPNKDHSPSSIYNMVMADPDPIISNFKPSYSFISHYITKEGSADKIGDMVEKSFLPDFLKSIGEKPYKVTNGIKAYFKSMANVLTSPETECFKEVDGRLVPTIKGEVTAKARGINGLLFAETMFHSGLEELTPEEMAAVACGLTPTDAEAQNKAISIDVMVHDTLFGIDKLKEKIEKIEDKSNVDSKQIILNRVDAQYISQWAKATGTDSRSAWEKIVKLNSVASDDSSEPNKFTEGGFLKSVNDTVDVLEQIKEVSRFIADESIIQNDDEKTAEKMKRIQETASKAVKLIQKDPVTYNLD